MGIDTPLGSWKEFLAARAARGDHRAVRRLSRKPRGLAIKSSENRLQALPSRNLRTSRGSIVHNLPHGVRLRESAGSIELLGDARDDALEQLVNVAKQRFGTKRVSADANFSSALEVCCRAQNKGVRLTTVSAMSIDKATR